MKTIAVFALFQAVFFAAATASESHVITGCWPTTVADAAPYHPPSFDQFHVAETFKGKVADPDVTSHPKARLFRTMIRTGAPKSPNFAGHFSIVGWGCGAACTDIAIIDNVTGKVFFPPFHDLVHYGFDIAPGEPEPQFHPIRFRPDSSLLIVIGEATARNVPLGGIRYYNWTGSRFRLIKEIKTTKTNCER